MHSRNTFIGIIYKESKKRVYEKRRKEDNAIYPDCIKKLYPEFADEEE